VTKFPNGSFVVLAHYAIQRDGNTEEIDRALPVLDHKPDPAGWTKVDNATVACAYLQAGSTLTYESK
jgi:hypothetical protein